MERETPKGRRMSGSAVQAAVAVVCILLGALLTFIPELQVRTLCYVFCWTLVAAGVIAIVYFFLSGAYRRLDDYNFALGVLLLILGCCGFARIEGVEGSFSTCLGILVLVLGAITLQNTVQMRVLDSGLWLAALVFTALILFGAVTILLDVRAVWNLVRYWILIIGGGLGLVSLILTALVLRQKAKAAAAPPADPAPAEKKPEPPSAPELPATETPEPPAIPAPPPAQAQAIKPSEEAFFKELFDEPLSPEESEQS